MKTEKNIRKGFGLAGKIAMFCIGLVSLVLTSCESELEIQQNYPFTVETMPVPKELNRLSVYRGNNAGSQGTEQE